MREKLSILKNFRFSKQDVEKLEKIRVDQNLSSDASTIRFLIRNQ